MCPYYKNKEVFDSFNEMVEAFGGKSLTEEEFRSSELRRQRTGQDLLAMEHAYRCYHLNNGNFLDKAPNGKDSILFKSLLDLLRGDRKKAILEKGKVFSDDFFNWFGDWINDPANASKVVDENGEPLVVYHGATFSSDIKVFNPQTSYFTENKTEADKYGDKFRHPQDNSPKSIPVFLNIRNPHILDAEGREYRNINDGIFITFNEFLESHPEYENESWYWEYQVGEEGVNIPKNVMDAYHKVSTSKTVRTYVGENIGKNNDGVIVKNVLDPADGNVSKTVPITDYVPNSSNQIKSATGNNGDFSTENDDIYFHKTKKVNGTKNLSDEIQKEGNTTAQVVENVVQFLSDKFHGLKIHVVDEVSDITRNDPAEQSILQGILYRKNISSVVYHGEVYIVRSKLQKQGGQIASEEILHMLVKTLQETNPQLFRQLFNEAKRSFKKLAKEVENIYKEAGQDTIENELVTQALARYVNRDIQAGKHSRFAELVDKFVSWLRTILMKSSEQVGNFVYIDPSKLKDLTLQELSDLINAKDTKFDINLESEDILFHRNQSITQELYNVGADINSQRQQYINDSVQQFKQNVPDADDSRIIDVINKSREQFNKNYASEIMRQNQIRMAEMFGMQTNENGFFESSEVGQRKHLIEYFVNSLQQSTFEMYIQSIKINRDYNPVGSASDVLSLQNILYNYIYDGDIQSLDKEIIRDYIRMFWDSELIQASLKVLDSGNETASQLEDKLVQELYNLGRIEDTTTLKSKLAEFWEKFKQLVNNILGGITFTEQDKNNILKASHEAYLVSEDMQLMKGNSVIYEMSKGDASHASLLTDKDKEIFKNIVDGTKTRLRSHMSRTSDKKRQKLINELKTRLELIGQKNPDNVDDVFEIVENFLVTANKEIGQTRDYIDRTLLAPQNAIYGMDSWNPQEINFIQQDLIGYYTNLLDIITNVLSDPTSAIGKIDQLRSASGNNISLRNLSLQLMDNVRSLQSDYNNSIVKPYVKKLLLDYVNQQDSITNKELFVSNMNRWLDQDETYGDLAAGEVLIGMASRSKSSVVRIVEKMMSEAEFKTERQVLKKGHELMRLYDKIRPAGSRMSPVNWQKKFMEFDRDGIPTGYFIRDINYGQFYRDKDNYEQQLRDEFGLLADEDGNTIFPDEDYVSPNSVYNRYYDKLDEWLDKKCNRRYTLDYYKQKRRFLSPKTIQAQNSIQRQIDLLLKDAIDEFGFVDKSKLTQNERRQLDLLRKQKRDLGSHYIFKDSGNGILAVEEKTGDALKMADEISEWNRFVSDKIKYKPDWDQFNAAKEQMRKNGATEQQILEFERNNTVQRLTPEFYEILKKCSKSKYEHEELLRLQKRYSEIISELKSRPGVSSQNLSKLGLGINTDRSGWKELHRIEQRMADIKKQLRKNVEEEVQNTGKISFEQIAAIKYVTAGSLSDGTYLEYLIKKWKDAAVTDNNLLNIFNQMFTYVDEKGKRKYLKAFTYLTPRSWTIKIGDQEIETIRSYPGSEYSELDLSSPFVNKNFDKDGPSLQPNAEYKNEKYSSLSQDELAFLNALVSTMDEANRKIPQKALSRDFLLPQISGRTMSIVSNALMTQQWSTAIGYPFRKFGVTYSETEDDVTTNMDVLRRPDGTVVNNIPIRYIRKLKNPIAQTTDVLGSVITFYQMACNYENKSQNLPTLELIKYSIRPEMVISGHTMDEQYKKVENLLDQRYYGKETSFGFKSGEKITPNKQKAIQTTKTIRNLASVALLGVNFTTIEVGYIDAMCQMLADAFGGKYITGQDMFKGFFQGISHTIGALRGLGKPVVNDKLVAAMQYNQLSRSNSDIFAATDQFKLDKFVKEHLLMGGYTLADYMVNSTMLLATYNHYRLLVNPHTNKKSFMSKSDAINTFTKYGYTEKEAIKIWEKSKITLWDAYKNENGDFVLKDEYAGIVTENLENRIAGRLRDRTAIYNGIIPLTEKAKLQQNVFGSYITLMRNFYVNTYWDRFKTGGDYITDDGDRHITWSSEYRRDDLGLENLETGEFEGAVFKDFARGIYLLVSNLKRFVVGQNIRKLNSEQKYAVKRCTAELCILTGMLFMMLWSVAFARSHDYDEDKDPVWTLNVDLKETLPWNWFNDKNVVDLDFNFKNADDKFLDFLRWKLALLSTRGFTERFTPWWLPTAFEPLTSPTVVTSYLDDIGVIWGLVIDLFSQRTSEEIKQGPYKHMTRGTRDVLKLLSPLGFDNLVRQWHTDGIKSTFRYYRGLKPIDVIVPTQQEWNESHGTGKHGGKGGKNTKSDKIILE